MSGDGQEKSRWTRPLFGSREPSTRRWGWRSTVGLVLLIIFVDVAAGASLTGLLFLLVFGWIGFIARVANDWRWSSAGLISFVVFAAILIAGAHVMLRWLRRSGDPAAVPWPWRWTIRLSVMVLLLFAVGVAMVGVIHQATWLTREDIFSSEMQYRGHSHIHQLQSMLEKQPMTAAQAGTWLQAKLPQWRVVVLPIDDQIGAIILTENHSNKADHVTVALLQPDKRFSIESKRRTTVNEQVARCVEALNQARAVP